MNVDLCDDLLVIIIMIGDYYHYGDKSGGQIYTMYIKERKCPLLFDSRKFLYGLVIL